MSPYIIQKTPIPPNGALAHALSHNDGGVYVVLQDISGPRGRNLEHGIHSESERALSQARRNRQKLRAIMARYGFANYRKEWWHYSYKIRKYPRTYHDFIIRPRPVQKEPSPAHNEKPLLASNVPKAVLKILLKKN